MWGAVLLIVGFCAPGRCSAERRRNSSTADWLSEIGQDYYRQGRLDDALREFNKALMIQPDHPEALKYLRLLMAQEQERPVRRPAPAAAREQEPVVRPSAAEDEQRSRVLMREAVMKAAMDQAAAALAQRAGRSAAREAAMEEALLKAGTVIVRAPRRQESAQEAPVRTTERERVQGAIEDASTRLAREALLKSVLGGEEPIPAAARPGDDQGRAGEAAPSVPAERASDPLPETPAGIRVVVNGETLRLERPLVIEHDALFVPLNDVAASLGYSVISLGQGNIQLIAPDGETLRLTLASTDPALLITEGELRQHLALRTRYDGTDRTLYLQSAAAPSFQTYTIPKSEEQLQEEEAVRQMVERVERGAEEPGLIPDAAKPSIVLDGRVSYSYDDPHAAAPFRTLTTGVGGKVYGWNVAYESIRKDIDGVFQHDYTFLNLRRPGWFIGAFDQQTNLAPLRSQFEEFNGLKVRRGWGEQAVQYGSTLPYRTSDLPSAGAGSATTLAWGQTEQHVSGGGGTVTYVGDLYQAQHEWAPSDWLRLKSAMFYLENEANYLENSGLSEFPRTNLVNFGDVGVRLPGDAWVSAQLSHADYRPDNQPDTSVEDWNWRTAFDWQKPRHRVKLAYEFVGEDYASLGNPGNYQDYKGLTAFGSYRLTNRWSMSGSFMRYRNNLNDDPQDTTGHNQAASLSTSFQPWRDQSFSLRFGHLTSNPEGGLSTGSSSHSRSYGVDYSLPFLLKSRALASYEYFRTIAPAGSDSASHSTGATLFKSFGRGSSWSVSERFRRESRELEEDSTSLDTSMSVNLQISPKLTSYANGSYARSLTDGAEHGDNVAASLGLRYNTIADTTVGVEYQIGSYNLDTERGRWPRAWSVLWLVTKRFGFSSPPRFGRIEGVVFRDLNGNGSPDAGEPGAEEAMVSLANGQRKTLTDAQGRFAFARVTPGNQTVQLDLSNLDPAWMIPEPRRTVAIRGHRTSEVVFPLVQGGAIEGVVFIDGNGDGVFQDTEEPMEAVAVMLLPGEDFRKTDPDGLFRFEDLLPGAYTVQLFPDDIPGGYELVSPGSVEAAVAGGRTVGPVGFALRLTSPVQQF